MSAYKHALALSLRDGPQRIALARAVLESGDQAVLLEGAVALRLAGNLILAEVVDPFFRGSNSRERFENLIERGQALLQESTLGSYLDPERLRWIVVADYGTGTQQLWPVPEERP
jgi:hypothetical protein